MASTVKAQIRTTGEFTAEPELKRQLSYLQKSVQQGFEDSDARHVERAAPSAIVTSDYQAKLGELVLCDAPTAGLTVFLPHASGSDSGRGVRIKNATSGTNTVTILPPGGSTIDGGSSASISAALERIHLMWAGDGWWVV